MRFPERFANLPPYAFPRLRDLLANVQPGGEVLSMSIGEPTHPMPSFVDEVLAENIAKLAKYPPNNGSDDLLSAISGWIKRRYNINVDPATEIMALNGTREGLFSSLIALCPETKNGKRSKVLIPNPFYQVYMVASITIDAEPVFVNATSDTGFLPDYTALDPQILDQTSVAYICSPSNPQGAVASKEYWTNLINLAEKHDFKIFADECYSEVYRYDKPAGALEIAREIGADPERVVIFHSLSKRSNLPGLRSGFAASGPKNIAALKILRAYTGAPLPNALQEVAARTWADEEHVNQSRAMYCEKYKIADDILGHLDGYLSPEAGFFLWLPVDDGETAVTKLYSQTGVLCLPGAYLSQTTKQGNPGAGYIRVALVADNKKISTGLQAIKTCLYEVD